MSVIFRLLSVDCLLIVCLPKKWSVNELLIAKKRFTLNSQGWAVQELKCPNSPLFLDIYFPQNVLCGLFN